MSAPPFNWAEFEAEFDDPTKHIPFTPVARLQPALNSIEGARRRVRQCPPQKVNKRPGNGIELHDFCERKSRNRIRTPSVSPHVTCGWLPPCWRMVAADLR